MPSRLPLSLRNALADLAVDALDVAEPARQRREDAIAAIAWLGAYERIATEAEPVVDLGRLRVAGPQSHPGASAADDRGLDRLRHALMVDAGPGPSDPPGIALRPEFLPHLRTVGDHVRRYQMVLAAGRDVAAFAAVGLPGVVIRSALLFNAGLFFEVHEILEAAWRSAAGREKTFLQGLVQIAVAFYQYDRGNTRGARSLLEAGAEKIQTTRAVAPPVVDLGAMMAEVSAWRVFLDATAGGGRAMTAPPLPQLRILPSGGAGQ